MSNENPFSVTRLKDPCLTKAAAEKISDNLRTIDEILSELKECAKTNVTRQHWTKLKQTQHIIQATLVELKQGLEAHTQLTHDFCQVTVDRLKRHMLNVNGKRLPLKVLPYRSGKEKSLYIRDLEKRKNEAAEKGKLKKKAKIQETLLVENKFGK